MVLVGGATRAVAGWAYPGYGTRVGRGRGIPVPSTLLEGGSSDSEAGPVSPC